MSSPQTLGDGVSAWLNQDALRRLETIVGPAGLVTDPEQVRRLCTDWLGRWHGRAAMVVRPGSTAETAAVLRWCHATRTPLVTQGGNTGMSGGATPDDSGAQLLLSTTRLNRIRAVDRENATLTVEAGATLAQVREAAAAIGRQFPLSLGAEGSCTIGGNIATNAGGPSVLRYGTMRDLVLGLEVVLPDGRVWNGLRALRKDNAGYDLRGLFAGSEGTLGVITAAVLKLLPATPARATAWLGARTLQGLVNMLARLRDHAGERLVACELLSAQALDLVVADLEDVRPPLADGHACHALVELADAHPSGLEEALEAALGGALEAGDIDDVVLCRTEAQRAACWTLRESISQAQVRAGHAVKHDVALPTSALPAFAAEAGAAVARLCPTGRLVNFGHLGDGNLHFNVLLPLDMPAAEREAVAHALNEAVHDLVAAHGGSISAEHGVGQLRRDELRRYRSPLEIELMQRIKRALDPNHLLNPGKVL